MNARRSSPRENAIDGNTVADSPLSSSCLLRPQVLSFFCGAGGLDLGFIQAGYDVIFAADYDQAAIDTHNNNSEVPCAVKLDLLQVKPTDITDHLRKVKGQVAPVGIIGGPPCQGFSRANTQRSESDPRNTLARRYARLIVKLAEIYPIQFFVFENVPELLAEKNSAILRGLKRKLSERFKISLSLLNAADFGVPQTRERLFLVGLRRGENGEAPKFEFPQATAEERKTVRHAIGKLPDPAFFHRSLTPKDIPHHPNHWTMQPRSRRFGADLVSSGRSLIRLDWEKPSRTVAYGHREIHVHPSGLRRLSIYEAMLLQGFPPTYKLQGNLSQQVTQVSNAVPPPVAEAIARQLLTYITPAIAGIRHD